MSESMTELERKFFHIRLIEFATTGGRLFTITWNSTWYEFYRSYNNVSYFGITVEELKKEFIEVILPNILNYDLRPDQRTYIESLQNHFLFERNDNGFQPVVLPRHQEVRVASRDDLLSIDSGNKSAPTIDSKVQVKNADQLKRMCAETIDPLQHAWVSCFVSSDYELRLNVLIQKDKILKRLQEMKEIVRNEETLPKSTVLPHVQEMYTMFENFHSDMANLVDNNEMDLSQAGKKYCIPL